MRFRNLQLAKSALDEGRISAYGYEFYCREHKKTKKRVSYLPVVLVILLAVLGEAEGIAVALVGQVLVKVVGSVEIGDLLVSSPREGYALACRLQELTDGNWDALRHNERCRNSAFARALESRLGTVMAVLS